MSLKHPKIHTKTRFSKEKNPYHPARHATPQTRPPGQLPPRIAKRHHLDTPGSGNCDCPTGPARVTKQANGGNRKPARTGLEMHPVRQDAKRNAPGEWARIGPGGPFLVFAHSGGQSHPPARAGPEHPFPVSFFLSLSPPGIPLSARPDPPSPPGRPRRLDRPGSASAGHGHAHTGGGVFPRRGAGHAPAGQRWAGTGVTGAGKGTGTGTFLMYGLVAWRCSGSALEELVRGLLRIFGRAKGRSRLEVARELLAFGRLVRMTR